MFAQQLKNKIESIKKAIEADKQKLYDKAQHEFSTFENYVWEMKPYLDTLFANRNDLLAIDKKIFVLDFCTVHIESGTVVFSLRDLATNVSEWLKITVQPDSNGGLCFEYKVTDSGLSGAYRTFPFPRDVEYKVSSVDDLIKTSKHDCWINFFIDELSKINRALRVNIDNPDSVGDCILNLL